MGDKSITLDQVDRRLLYQLRLNSRQSLKELASRIRQSPQALHYRIKRLTRLKVISGFPTFIDFSKLVYEAFRLWFRVSTNKRERKELLDFLISHSSITRVEDLMGKNDLLVTIIAKNDREFHGIFLQIMDKFSSVISSFSYFSSLAVYSYPKTHFILRDPEKFFHMLSPKRDEFHRNISEFYEDEPHLYGDSSETVEIDNEDRKILDILAQDAYISTKEVAQKVKLSVDTVRTRIKELEKKKIIVSYSVTIEYSLIGYQHSELFVKFQAPTSELFKHLETYCRINPYVAFYIPLAGYYDVEIVFDSRNNEHFYMLVNELRSRFSEITDFEAVSVTHIHKWRTVPNLEIKKSK